MAILAPPDWTYSPRDPAMDKGPNQQSAPNNAPPNQQQRPTQLPPPQHPQQYPFQQQPQGTWTPSLAAPPFYPGAFYQNGPPLPPQQGPYPPPQQQPYGFDPANAQLAQWAYQQMMYAQMTPPQQQGDFFAPPPGMHGAFNPFPSGTPPPRPNEPQYAGFHPYRRPSRQQSHDQQVPQVPRGQEDWRPQPPYSRGDASGSSSSVNSQGRARTNSNNSQRAPSSHKSHSPVPSHSPAPSTKSPSPSRDAAPGGPPRIPHHRAGSSSSTSSSASASERERPSLASTASSSSRARPSPLSQGTVTAPAPSARPPARSPLATSSSTPASTTRTERRMSRDDSSLALSSLSLLATRADTAATTGKEHHAKGSGLKGRLRRALSFNASVALKEEVGGGDDDGETEDGDGEGEGAGSGSEESIKASVVNPKAAQRTPAVIASATRRPGASSTLPSIPPPSPSTTTPSPSTSTSTSTTPYSNFPGAQVPMPKKKSRAASLFNNARLNASTDNISLSSTVSSASVMIRKLGSMGRLARRNSLAGITGLFKKDKDKKGGEDEEETEDEAGGGGKGKGKKKEGKDKEDKGKGKDKDKKGKNKSGKGEASEASVSHATAELEAGDWSVPHSFDNSVGGGGGAALSPAAKLARQHTLKSNAEAAAKAREAAARAAAVVASANAANAANAANGNGSPQGGVPTWERNTATRSPGRGGGGRNVVAEDGTRVFVEEGSGSGSEDEYDEAPRPQQQQYGGPQHPQQQQQQQWAEDEGDDSDEGWGLLGGEEDDTIRVGDVGQAEEEDDGEHEPWAVDVRRSVERTRVPARGILKHAGTYDQSSYLPDAHPSHPSQAALRHRSNSYNSPHGHQAELGPLARIPSPDPDHIDGLHRHGSHSSAHGGNVHGRDALDVGGSSSGDGGLAAKRSSVPSLPPLSFDLGLDGAFDSPQATPTAATYAASGAGPSAPASGTGTGAGTPPAHNTIYAHPALNSSAPALTSFASPAAQSPIPRAATAPAAKKVLAFASNLSVYDTFSASMYDRRSEPATWSRLTPALAQRIKEELNSYKMEEMEVHAASRIHTQFFV
ncbi:hypothetical protein B0H16DRAFT_997306 [Mycena metata]|uniref:Uncharacterized protein n=1 Tax=Mycena metata TaxID=1033252 RepID=A0AAD7II98_9AGAR|nr:hypothetical protein B0H16DRAFT_997306 [Mycena metata]